MRELYELREALETQAARLFAERATAVHRRELLRLAGNVDALFERLAGGGEDDGFRFAVHSQHLQFHMWIAEHANSQLLKQMIERKHVLILNWIFDITGRRTPLPPGFHSLLAEGLVSGDPEKADALMRAHVRYGFGEISTHIGALGASEWRERRQTPATPPNPSRVRTPVKTPTILLALVLSTLPLHAQWPQFRGPDGNGPFDERRSPADLGRRQERPVEDGRARPRLVVARHPGFSRSG